MEENKQMPMQDYKDMSVEQKIDYIAMRLASLDNVFSIYVKYNKNEDKFKRFLEKERAAQKLAWEQRKKELEEIKEKEENEKVEKNNKS